MTKTLTVCIFIGKNAIFEADFSSVKPDEKGTG